MPAPAAGSDVVGRPKPGPKQQHKQQPQSPARQPPRSIYQGKERIPFWDAPLLVAVAANLVWPAVLLLLTGWSMLVVLYFRLERLVWATVLRRPSGAEYEGEDDAPVDVGLYWFGYGNHCERHAHEPSGGTAPHRYFDPRKPSVIYVHGFARRTTARCFRETFNWAHNDAAYGLDVNAAGACVCAHTFVRLDGWLAVYMRCRLAAAGGDGLTHVNACKHLPVRRLAGRRVERGHLLLEPARGRGNAAGHGEQDLDLQVRIYRACRSVVDIDPTMF